MINFSINDIIFQDKNIRVTDVTTIDKEGGKLLEIKAESIKPIKPVACPNCGCDNFEIKDYYIRKFKHLDCAGYKTKIYYKQTRYKCKECNKTTNEIISIVEKSSRITIKLKDKILKDCGSNRSIEDISRENNLSSTAIVNMITKDIKVDRLPLSSIICFDEYRGPAEKGKFPFIMVDPVNSSIIDIVGSREQTYLYTYFNQIDKEEREKVEYIITDLTAHYLNVIKDFFPKAKHIADRFHYLRLAIEGLQEIRIEAMKFHLNVAITEAKRNAKTERQLNNAIKSNEHYKYYRTLKDNYRLLSFNTYDGSQIYWRNKGKIYKDKTEYTKRQILEYMLNGDDDIEEAYLLLQELYKIAYQTPYSKAKNRLNEWFNKVKQSKKHINPLKRVVKTFEEWENQIANSFIINNETYSLMTNACCEAKNNTIKTIIKDGYGLKTFKLMRIRILQIDRQRKEINEELYEKKRINYLNKLKNHKKEDLKAITG